MDAVDADQDAGPGDLDVQDLVVVPIVAAWPASTAEATTG